MRKWVLAVVLAGCAHQSPSERAAEEASRIRCASIELYPVGVSPGRPYRSLGPVVADGGRSIRDESLREAACRLGADAVVDYRVEAFDSGQSSGAGGSLFQERGVVTGTAVAYVEERKPPPPVETAPPPVEAPAQPAPAPPAAEPAPSAPAP